MFILSVCPPSSILNHCSLFMIIAYAEFFTVVVLIGSQRAPVIYTLYVHEAIILYLSTKPLAHQCRRDRLGLGKVGRLSWSEP